MDPDLSSHKHHLLPRSRGGGNGKNKRKVSIVEHRAWHKLFWNLTPREVTKRLLSEEFSLDFFSPAHLRAWQKLGFEKKENRPDKIANLIERIWSPADMDEQLFRARTILFDGLSYRTLDLMLRAGDFTVHRDRLIDPSRIAAAKLIFGIQPDRHIFYSPYGEKERIFPEMLARNCEVLRMNFMPKYSSGFTIGMLTNTLPQPAVV